MNSVQSAIRPDLQRLFTLLDLCRQVKVSFYGVKCMKELKEITAKLLRLLH